MSINAKLQGMEPGSIIELFEIDGESIGAGIYRFHADTTSDRIVFQGLEYSPWPMKAEGFEMKGKGAPNKPKITMGNVNGFVTALCLSFRDMVGAKFTRRQTFVEYLDGMPEADPSEEMPIQVWRIEQKTGQTKTQVQFELSNNIDFRNQLIPARQITGNLCGWRYRGAECGYNGPPVADRDDNPTTNPELDQCSLYTTGCKLRFGEFGELPIGSFPSSGLTR